MNRVGGGGWHGGRKNGGGADTSTPESPPLYTIPTSSSSSVPHPLIIYTPFSPCSCTPRNFHFNGVRKQSMDGSDTMRQTSPHIPPTKD